MKKLIVAQAIILLTINCSAQITSFNQISENREQMMVEMRKMVVSIGAIVYDSAILSGKKIYLQRFQSLGSGIMSYVNYDTFPIPTVVTARHVIKFFADNHLDAIYIRPSWADTIKTTDYFGIQVPLVDADKTLNIFLSPEPQVDLGCVIIRPNYMDSLYKFHSKGRAIRTFPIRSMTHSYLGDQVWIGGYPAHIESDFQQKFFYNISTFKPGYIAWKPPVTIENKDLRHITLIESNASYGNSGGPVFSVQENVELAGILVAGFNEEDGIYLDNQAYTDSLTKKPFLAKRRAGVSIMENAEYVQRLLLYVHEKIKLY